MQVSKFYNTTERDMSIEDVFNRIKSFMSSDPRAAYTLAIGTDSQEFAKHTRFITGIAIIRQGKGSWICGQKTIIPRKMYNLREKIYQETLLSQEIISFFDIDKQNQLVDIIIPYLDEGAEFKLEGHLDIGKGKRNKTSQFVSEMTAIIEATGFSPKIKPYSYIATCYADRLSK